MHSDLVFIARVLIGLGVTVGLAVAAVVAIAVHFIGG
jgi:hypothetical protein